MATIINRDSTSGPDNYSAGNILDDAGGMSREAEQQFGAIREMAVSSITKRKPIFDFKTKNQSFIDLYSDLHRLGVKNNKFFLKLYDRDLVGVEVYKLIKPPIQLQLKIILECMINPWYYLREVCRIPQDGMPIEPGGGVAYQIDRNNVACWYLFLNGLDFYQSKPRQRGKTQDCMSRFNYAFLFGTMASVMQLFNKDKDGAIANLGRLKDQRSLLPVWMQMRTIVTEEGKLDKGIDNVTTVQNPVNGNRIIAMGSATNRETAMKLGRGATSPLQNFDEFDFFPYNTEVINASVFAYSRAADVAKSNKGLYGRAFSSTPGDLSSRDGKEAAEYISHMLRWNDVTLGENKSFFDRDINEIKKVIANPANKYVPIIYVEHGWQQLKLPRSWYEKQCNLVGYKEDVILREILLQRINGSDLSPFKRSAIIYITTHMKHPIEKDDMSKCMAPFCIYEKLNRSYPYILAIDPSEGLGNDNNACTLINPYTLKPAMEFRCNYVSQPDFQKMLERFMDKYCPKCLIVPEANKGREIINCFLNSKYRYQVYYDDNKLAKSKIASVDEFGAARQAAMERRAYGFDTTRGNRPELYAIIENFMEENLGMIYTEFIVDDVAGLIRKGPRIEAGSGKHDDNIMSYLLGLFVYYNAKAEFLEQYGIRRGALEPGTSFIDNRVSPEEQVAELRNMYSGIPTEIQSVIKEILDQKDPIEEMWKYEAMLEQERIAIESQYRRHARDLPDNIHTLSGVESDDSFWSRYDASIIQSNFDQDDRFKVDIDSLF